MKSTHHIYATHEDREKLIVIGSPAKPQNNYTKADFLTPAKVGQKFNMPTKDAENFMKKLYSRRACFVLNGRIVPIIMKFGTFSLHPMGIEAFQQQLQKQRG